MFESLKKLVRDEAGNTIMAGVGMIIGLVILLSIGGLIASTFVTAANLSADSAFNVDSTITQYYPLVVLIAFVAIFTFIAMPVINWVIGGGMSGGQH
jgi:hypothetical protein